MKAAWLREKKRFAAEAERLERETMESVQAQTDARCNLREAFEACYNTAAAGPGAMEVEDAANSAEWEATVAGWNQEAQPDWNSVLQRAYGDVSPPADTEADAGIRRPNAGAGAAPLPATPPAHFGGLYARPPMNATYDPYQAAMTGTPSVPAVPCGSIPPGLTPATSIATKGDLTDKTGPSPSTTTVPEPGYGPSPVQERLNRRRALEPFGGKPVPLDTMSGASCLSSGQKVFVEDDPDEFSGADGPPDSTKQPGVAIMEWTEW